MLPRVEVKVMVCDMFGASLANNLEMLLVVAISFLVVVNNTDISS